MALPVVILAGGLGTRMRDQSKGGPKHLIPVAGLPFADHQLRWLAGSGATDVIYSIGFKGNAIREYVGDGSRYGLATHYIDEGSDLRGTAGALRLCLDAGILTDRFLVTYGDSYLPIDIKSVWDVFCTSTHPALMTVYRNQDLWDRSNVIYRDGRIVLYDKHSMHFRSEMEWIDYGLMGLTSEIVRSHVAPGRKSDLGDLLSELSSERNLVGFEVSKRFFEIGSPGGLADLSAHLGGSLEAGLRS